jgi:hypothetical protein
VEHLREELRAYASDDEPPMRLEFDKVMTAARRSKRRLQTSVIATSVVAVAVVATLVSVVVSNSPPVETAGGTPSYCRTAPKEQLSHRADERNQLPTSRPQDDTPRQDKRRLSCVLYEVVPPQLPEGAELRRTVVMDHYDPEGEGPLEVAPLGPGVPINISPGQPRPEPPSPATVKRWGYQVFANVAGPNGAVFISIRPAPERPKCDAAAGACERQPDVGGAEVWLHTFKISDQINRVAVSSWRQGTEVIVSSTNRLIDVTPDPQVGKHPLSVDGMIKIATAPGLYLP